MNNIYGLPLSYTQCLTTEYHYRLHITMPTLKLWL